MLFRSLAGLGLSATILLVAGCGEEAPQTPQDAAEDFVNALAEQDYGRICDLTDDTMLEGSGRDCVDWWEQFVSEASADVKFDPANVRYDVEDHSDWDTVVTRIPGIGTFELQYGNATVDDRGLLLTGFSFDD